MDDFGQMRKLSHVFADELRKRNPGVSEIGIAFVQHAPGFEADRTMQLVSDWLTRFGRNLKEMVLLPYRLLLTGSTEKISQTGVTFPSTSSPSLMWLISILPSGRIRELKVYF